MLRLDLGDRICAGNKLYKLKYHLKQAESQKLDTILTFGGAFSNHIAATARVCLREGFKSVGIIRGERIEPFNPTLRRAEHDGMQLEFMKRSEYREKHTTEVLNSVQEKFPRAFIIPEGGAGEAGIRGAAEILPTETKEFDVVVCAVGTGTTCAGLLRASSDHQKIVAIPIHNHPMIMDEVLEAHSDLKPLKPRLEVWAEHHWGGYAKWNHRLLERIRSFHKQHGIQLDPIYTGKAYCALMDRLRNGALPNAQKALFIHTGGMQGIEGFEQQHGVQIFPENAS